MEMIYVRDFYSHVCSEHTKYVAKKFFYIMRNWDGSPDFLDAFYTKELLELKLKEAKE